MLPCILGGLSTICIEMHKKTELQDKWWFSGEYGRHLGAECKAVDLKSFRRMLPRPYWLTTFTAGQYTVPPKSTRVSQRLYVLRPHFCTLKEVVRLDSLLYSQEVSIDLVFLDFKESCNAGSQ